MGVHRKRTVRRGSDRVNGKIEPHDREQRRGVGGSTTTTIPRSTAEEFRATMLRDGNPRVSANDDWRWEDEYYDDDDDDDDRDNHCEFYGVSDVDDGIAKGTNDATIHGGGGGEDDVSNMMVSIFIRVWCVVWAIFALSVVIVEMSMDRNARARNEQLYLELSESVVSNCAYSNLDTEHGRESCRELCHNHMCCFVDDDDDNDGGGGGGCSHDPRKMCAAHAGCQSLVVSEEDAIIYDADGMDVFGDDDDVDDGGGRDNVTTTTTTTTTTMTDDGRSQQSTSSMERWSSDGGDDSAVHAGGIPDLASDMQLVQRVIFAVCSTANLRTQHGMMECASICNPSVCCFDRYEILSMNPKLDIVLELEGIDETMLDTSEMGKCIPGGDDGGGGSNATSNTMGSNFCRAHIGCKNIFLLGSSSAAHLTHIFADDFGGTHQADDRSAYDVDPAEKGERYRTIITVFVLFGIIIGITTYLLIHEREYSPLMGVKLPSNRPDEEHVEFV